MAGNDIIGLLKIENGEVSSDRVCGETSCLVTLSYYEAGGQRRRGKRERERKDEGQMDEERRIERERDRKREERERSIDRQSTRSARKKRHRPPTTGLIDDGARYTLKVNERAAGPRRSRKGTAKDWQLTGEKPIAG